jgi:hypothetical protein
MKDGAMLLVESDEPMQASGRLNMESPDMIPAATNSRARMSSRSKSEEIFTKSNSMRVSANFCRGQAQIWQNHNGSKMHRGPG